HEEIEDLAASTRRDGLQRENAFMHLYEHLARDERAAQTIVAPQLDPLVRSFGGVGFKVIGRCSSFD
ncbi:MAG: hypothetical protein J2P54_08550, partial [Bradyrhizobiaceae bacterium]|nr:hypothetical protein [Bradyrhizobiaceae bacterium]